MTKYVSTAIFSVLLFTVIIFTALNYHNNDVLETRINTLYKNSKDLNASKTFKEEYYILQQAHDTNVILVVFGLLVAVIGFFTYQNVVAKFDLITVELKNEIANNKQEGQAIIDELGDLQIEFYIQSAELLKENARNSRMKGNIQMYVYHSVASASKSADLCQWFMNNYKGDNTLDIGDVKANIVTYLQRVERVMSSGIETGESTLGIIEGYIANIRKIESVEANKVLSQIHAKIKVKQKVQEV